MFLQRMVVLTLTVVCLSYTTAKPTTFDTTDDLLVVVTDSNNEDASDLYTTDEPNAPIQLTEMDVMSTISLRHAHTAVVTRVRNPARTAQETTFRMLLPDTAFISGFTMTVDGKSYKALVKKKEEAKQIYGDAVSHGYGAAHIAVKARDSHHFSVSMNLEPKSTVVFNLTYEELLVRRNGVYNHAINLHPGALVPKMQVTVHIKEPGKISTVRVPEIRTGNEIDADENAPQNGNVVINRTEDDREVIITFSPDAAEQRRLIRVYAEKSGSRGQKNEGLLGQFVVQYDVDRSSAGEILVNDGYFVHFFAPTSLHPLPKHVVFVLDTSISMRGREIAQLRDAMKTILNNLNKGDLFSIVQFNTFVRILDLSEGNGQWKGYDKIPALRIPREATPENIAKAQTIISELNAGGVTNMAEALVIAVDIAHEVARHNNNAENAVATENNKLESIIIFLTDGQPTAGITNPDTIINLVTNNDYEPYKASIFSLAFGSAPDRDFLRKLSLSNSGFMRHIYMGGDAALQLQDFYRTVSSPLLADVHFKYPKEQIKEESLTKNKFRTYFAGSETVVAGRLADDTMEISPQVLAICGLPNFSRRPYVVTPKVPVVHRENYFPLERIWAYLTIKQLLDQKDSLIKNNKNKSKAQDLEQKALDIALQYEFVTPLTSLVVVKPNDTRAVEVKPAEADNDVIYNRMGQSSRSGSGLTLGGSRPRILSGSHLHISLPPISFNPMTQINLDPPTTTAEPSTTTVEPTKTTSEPSTTTVEPTKTTSEATTTTVEPTKTNSEPSTTTSKPSTTTGEPTTTTAEPSTTTAKPSMTAAEALTTNAESSTKSAMFNVIDETVRRDPLEPYFLKEFPWTSSLLDAANGSLILHVNGTQINLKLTKDISAAPADGAACLAAGGGAARCQYLPRCGAARALSADLYHTSYCVLEHGYAGVCCPIPKEDAQNSIKA